MGLFTHSGPEREALCARLTEIGVIAEMSGRGKPEEKIGQGLLSINSLGLIDITPGPIRWINVRQNLDGEVGTNSYKTYCDYAVPVSTVPSNVKIKMAVIRKFPLVGPIIDRRWKGKDYGLGIIGRLNGDSLMKQRALIGVEIRGHPRHLCFTVTHENVEVTKEMWDFYQAITAHIIDSVS